MRGRCSRCLFFAALVWLLHVRWQSTLILYACFAVNWSTRQYVAHAFSKRDVVEGAWNLRHNRLMSWILLHGEFDLNHHRHPELSWYYLPSIESDSPQLSYVRQYWRLWRGPRLSDRAGAGSAGRDPALGPFMSRSDLPMPGSLLHWPGVRRIGYALGLSVR